MGRGSAKGGSPKKPSGKKASAGRRTAPKSAAKAVRHRHSSAAGAKADAANLASELSKARAGQAATSEILRIISQSTGNVQPVFDAIVLAAVRLLDCDRAHFLRCDATTFFPVAAAGPGGLLATTATTPVPIDPDANLPSRAILARRDMYLSDWSEIDLPAFERSARNLRGTNSSLLLPMLREGQCIGVLALASKRANNFDDSDIALAKSFRDKALIAIENARLFNETQEALERQKATADILKVIASSPSDVQPVFEAIVANAARLIGGFSAGVYRFVDGLVHIAAISTVSPAGDEVLRANFPRPIDDDIFRTLQAGEVLEIADTENQPIVQLKEIARARGFRSLLYVPLKSSGTSIGTIAVSRQTVGSFAPHHVELLQTFADQAVIAIENVRLFNETKEALERQTATADVLNVIGRSPTDAAPVFDVIGERAEKLCNAEISVVSVLDGDLIKLAGIRGISREGVELFRGNFPMPLDRQTVTARTINSGTIVHIGDVLADPTYDNKGLAAQTGYRSCLGVPMHNKGEVVGAIFVARTEPGLFSDNQIRLLQIFADQAVIATQNVRLFNETREALERQTATADILKVIASSPDDVQPVFDAIAERSNRIVEGRATAVYGLVDGVLHLRAFTPTSPEADARLRAFFPRQLSQMRWGEAIGRGELYEIEDMQDPTIPQDGRELSRLRGYRGLLLVPLVQDRQTIGAISVTRAEPGRFSDHHVALLKTFADQAVIAISNVGLFNEVQQRTRELSQSLDDLRTAQDRLVQTEKLASLGQLTAGIAHEIKNPLNFVNNFSALSAELTEELNDLLKRAALTDKMQEDVSELTKLLKDNLERVVQHGKRADSIVKNMLLHSRAGAGEQRTADVNALVEESLNLAYHGARAEKSGFNVTLQRDFDAAAGAAELFPQEITRALLNLISNGFYAATKRMTENGEAEFEPTLLAATKSLGNAVEIRIRDNGTGIPPEVKDKMFNPFFTTKPAGEGTGLGLSMTHDIVVKQHGGRIDVETEPGKFTEFVIVLPRAGNLQKAK